MGLHLVGETIDKTKSHYLAQTGKLVQLMRGIYVDAGDDIDRTVLAHAVRIARYLYPKTYLSGASAVLLGPTADGRLYITGARVQRTRIRALEIIRNKAPARPSIGAAVVADSLGEFPVSVSTPRQRLLEAFRLRSEHAASIDAAMREALARRLVEEYGATPMPRVKPHGRLRAKTTGIAKEKQPRGSCCAVPQARRSATRQPSRLPSRGMALSSALLRTMASSGAGRKSVTGLCCRLSYGRRYPASCRPSSCRCCPKAGSRRSSKITGTSARFCARASGTCRTSPSPARQMNWQAFPPRSSKPNWKTTARTGSSPGPVPGPDGTLAPSAGLPFTHIQKPAGTAGFQHLPLVEWVGLTLARGVGLPAPETALVVMPDDMPPALLVERLDIRDRADDRRMIAMEDMCSVLDLTPEEKYTRTIERVVRAPRTLSTDPEADLLTLLKRVLFAWLSADSDMHLKNMALLKTAQQGDAVFQAVRFAPVYDALTTRVFPGLEHYRMALKLGGKDERLGRAGFVAVTALAGLRAGDASVAMDAVLGRLTGAIDGIMIPPARLRSRRGVGRAVVGKTLGLCRERGASFG